MNNGTVKPTRLRKLLGWGLFGQVGYVISQFVVLLALARFTTVETVGAFGLASAISFTVISIFNLDLRVNCATDVEARFSFSDFLGLRAITCVGGFVLILAISWFTLEGPTAQILIVFAAAKTVELMSELCYGLFQRHDKMAMVARSQLIRGVLSAALFTLLLYLGLPATIAFIAQLIVWSIAAFAIDLPAARKFAIDANDTNPCSVKNMLTLARTSIPLGINGGLSALQGNIPRYAIGGFLGVAALGQFTVVAYVMQAMTQVSNAASQSVVSRMAKFIKQAQRTGFFSVLRKLITILSVFGLVSVILSLLFGDVIIRTVFGPEYDNLGTFLAVLTIAATLRSMMLFFQAGLQAARAFYSITIVRVCFVIIMAVVCFAAAKWGGLMAVGVAMAVIYLAQSLLFYIFLARLPFEQLANEPQDKWASE